MLVYPIKKENETGKYAIPKALKESANVLSIKMKLLPKSPCPQH